MLYRSVLAGTAIVAALSAGGCSTDTTGISTSSIDPKLAPTASAAAKIDPVCVTLRSQIDGLRKDGVVERIEKVSAGKSSTVSVKRASLAKMAELDKANAEFQAKCSTISPASTQAQSPASPVAQAVTNAAGSAATAAATNAASTATTKATNAAASAIASKATDSFPKLP